MTIQLNHTIVHARDKQASARFLAGILGVPVGPEAGPFVMVPLANNVTLDFMDAETVRPQHYAFLITEDEFDAAHERLLDTGVRRWADPDRTQPDEINHRDGGRGVYFEDPDGHFMEMLTQPYDPGLADGSAERDVDGFLSAWAGAERAGDAAALGDLLTDDFLGVGPLGFTLPKPAWVGRFEQGLAYETFDLDEIQTRLHSGSAVITLRQNHRGSHAGQPIPGAARATLAVVRDAGRLRLAGIHMSFVAGAPGSPPLPA